MPIDFPKTPKDPLTKDPKLLILFSKPKMGKTTALSLLPDNLILDLEDGSDFVGGLTLKVNNFKELQEVKSELASQEVKYDYITFDTTTKLEDMAITLGGLLYKKTPMGKKWGLKKDGKLINPAHDSIIKLPDGAGYLYVREAFQAIVEGFKPFVNKCIILSGHVNDKMVDREGEQVTELQLDLTGKLARIMQSKADAIGLITRKKDKVYADFNGGGDAIIEARPSHLSGQKILLSEKLEDGGIVAHWDSIFTELNQ